MPVVEMNEGDAAMGILGDKFLPSAPQSKFISTWGILEGEAKDVTGFKAERDLSQRQPFGHGSTRALSGWERAQVPLLDKEGKPNGKMGNHVISHNGVRLVEMICDRESVELKDRWTGDVSRRNIDDASEEELTRLDRLGIKREEDNMKPRLVSDTEDLPNKPPQ